MEIILTDLKITKGMEMIQDAFEHMERYWNNANVEFKTKMRFYFRTGGIYGVEIWAQIRGNHNIALLRKEMTTDDPDELLAPVLAEIMNAGAVKIYENSIMVARGMQTKPPREDGQVDPKEMDKFIAEYPLTPYDCYNSI